MKILRRTIFALIASFALIIGVPATAQASISSNCSNGLHSFYGQAWETVFSNGDRYLGEVDVWSSSNNDNPLMTVDLIASGYSTVHWFVPVDTTHQPLVGVGQTRPARSGPYLRFQGTNDKTIGGGHYVCVFFIYL